MLIGRNNRHAIYRKTFVTWRRETHTMIHDDENSWKKIRKDTVCCVYNFLGSRLGWKFMGRNKRNPNLNQQKPGLFTYKYICLSKIIKYGRRKLPLLTAKIAITRMHGWEANFTHCQNANFSKVVLKSESQLSSRKKKKEKKKTLKAGSSCCANFLNHIVDIFNFWSLVDHKTNTV